MQRLALVCVIAVAACGGGGGSSDSDAGPPVIVPAPGGEIWIHDPIVITFGEAGEHDIDVTDGDGNAVAHEVATSGLEVRVQVDADARVLGELHVALDGEDLRWTV